MHSKSVTSAASSAATSTVGVGRTEQFEQTMFQLIYLASGPQVFFMVLAVVLLFIDFAQMASFSLDPSLFTLSIFGVDLSFIQRTLTLVRVGSLAASLGTTALLAMGTTTLSFFVLFFLVCYFSARAIQQNAVPNMLLVRFIRVTLILFNTAGFIPVFSVLTALTLQYAGSFNFIDFTLFSIFGLASVSLTLVVGFTTLTSYPMTLTSRHPLARMHARVDMVYLISKAITVLLFQVDLPSRVMTGWMLGFLLLCTVLYTAFVPFYSMVTNTVRALSLYVLVCCASLGIHLLAATTFCALIPVVAFLPLFAYLVTAIPVSRFVGSWKANLRTVTRDKPLSASDQISLQPRRPILFPFQAEIALRSTVKAISRYEKRLIAIQKRVPSSLGEAEGMMNNDGTLNVQLLPHEWRDELDQLREAIRLEIDCGMRLFQVLLSRWPDSPFIRMAFINYVACYRTQTLTSVITNSMPRLELTKMLVIDVQYFIFICHRNPNSLQGDSSVMSRLEMQRNLSSVQKSQKLLTDQMHIFWSMVGRQRGVKLTLGKVNTFVGLVSRLESTMSMTEKLYSRVLKEPTPRLIRHYEQFVTLFSRPEMAAEYLNGLEGVADELEVVHMNSRGDIAQKKKITVQTFDFIRHKSSNLSLHLRAVVSVVAIATLFVISVLICIITLHLCRYVGWQIVITSGVALGANMISVGFSEIREGSPMALAAAVQCAGPMWKAVSDGMAESHIKAALSTYRQYTLPLLVAEDMSEIQDDPYRVISDVSVSVFEEGRDLITKTIQQQIYSIHSYLESEYVTVTTFSNGVPNGTTTKSVASFIPTVIYTAESIVSCIKNGGTIHSCTSELDDKLLSQEYSLVTSGLNAMFGVADRVFVVSQLFLLVQICVYVIIFTLFVLCFLFIFLVMYIIPVARSISFNAALISLFASLPPKMVNSIVCDFDRKKRRGRKMQRSRTSFTETNASPTHGRSRENFTDTSVAGPRQRLEPGSLKAHNRTLGLPAILKLPSKQSAATTNTGTGTRDTQDSTKEGDTLKGSHFQSRDSIGLDTDTVTGETDSLSSHHSMLDEFPESALAIALAATETSDPTTGSAPDLHDATLSNLSLAMGRRSVQILYAIRQTPILCTWLLLFVLIFVSMNLYALYETSDVSQSVQTIFIEYRYLLTLAHIHQWIAGSAWGAGAPLTTDEAALGVWNDLADLSEMVTFLSGQSHELSLIDSAWTAAPAFTRSVGARLLDTMAQDHWREGLYADEIAVVLHSTSCLRLVESQCSLSRRYDASKGLMPVLEAYLMYAENAAAELEAGMIGGPGQLFVNDTLPLDVLGGAFQIQGIMRTRFTEQVTNTQTNTLSFLVAFAVLLGLFYYIYLFRAIRRLSKVRTQFSLIFHSLRRKEIPAGLLAKFLLLFPEEDLE
ncbi:tmcB-like protein [Carpediemonas membranifera]|uniref:TmcB-like protein n=2 Tax=Carpediemonas membranifera TaxID=201153 RepID=A0A8J6B760_9EUKA|nr:tmcB-like protein [Carpediemonas membranifera]|eukprot:KAG9391392.1 tmcB-like protein [Carpediemonas membranifera]